MELRDFLNIIRARKWVIIRTLVVITLLAVGLTIVQVPMYESEVRILISEQDAGAAIFGTTLSEFSGQPERGLETQVQLMQVRPILENTIRRLELGVSPETLSHRITIAAVGQTNIVSITASDAKPEVAASIANTIADEYVTWSKDHKRESIQAAVTEVETRLEQAKSEILELGKRIADRGRSDDLAAELAIATGSYTTLANKLEELKVNEQLEVGSGRVVSPAVVPRSAVSPNPVRNMTLALALGLVLGLGLAVFNDYLDDTLKSSAEAEEIYAAPVLGHIPSEKFEKGEGRRLTLIQHPTSPAAEAYRVLRNSLDFVNFEHEIKTLLITSAAPAEGKSTVAANLAAGLAQAGKKVVFVNCDFRRPTTSEFFEVNNMIGLSDVLTGSNTLKAALQQPLQNLDLLVLVPGKMPPNPSELLGSRKMEELFTTLEEWAEWIIVDSPPLLAVADAAAVARWVDGVLIVTMGGTSTHGAGRKAREILENVGARIAGVVVWGLDGGTGGGGYGYYGAGTYSGYSYYSDYYSIVPSGLARGQGGASGSQRTSSGGGAPRITTAVQGSYPSAARSGTGLRIFGRIMTGLFMAVTVATILILIAYFVDTAMGWGIAASLLGR